MNTMLEWFRFMLLSGKLPSWVVNRSTTWLAPKVCGSFGLYLLYGDSLICWYFVVDCMCEHRLILLLPLYRKWIHISYSWERSCDCDYFCSVASWRGVAVVHPNFWLSEICWESFFLSEKFNPKMQNLRLRLKTPFLGKFRSKIEVWSIFCWKFAAVCRNSVRNLQCLSEKCNLLPCLLFESMMLLFLFTSDCVKMQFLTSAVRQ